MSDASDDCPALTAACRSSLLVAPSMCDVYPAPVLENAGLIDAHAPR